MVESKGKWLMFAGGRDRLVGSWYARVASRTAARQRYSAVGVHDLELKEASS